MCVPQVIPGLNMSVVKYNLLDAWLRGGDNGPGSAAGSLDETVTNSPLDKPGLSAAADDPTADLKRAVYLLRGLRNREGIDYLVQTALADQDGAVSGKARDSNYP